MSSVARLEQYIGIPYSFKNGPTQRPENLMEGINCQLLVHLVYRDYLGISLPEVYRSKEIFEDAHLFRNVNINIEPPQLGDIFLFGRDQLEDPRKLHLTIFTGRTDAEGDLLLIHANSYEGVSVWPLQRFFTYHRYDRIYAVKRFKNP